MDNTTRPGPLDWPAHTASTRPWTSNGRGTTLDRELDTITTALPPFIAHLDVSLSSRVLADLEAATVAATRLDATATSGLVGLLARAEAAASSRIEHEIPTLDDVDRAAIGLPADRSATVTVGAQRAAEHLLDAAATSPLTLNHLLTAHTILLGADPTAGPGVGALRAVQNWIGGSVITPRGAVHVPPPPDTVPDYMADLLEFANRDDLPALVQAAIVHAQFESIHPFTDGNGRIGRALINAVLRRRGITTGVQIPVSVVLGADVAGYFTALNAYRTGHVAPIVRHLAVTIRTAVDEAARTARQLADLPGMWRDEVRPRAGSATARTLDLLPDHPVLDADLLLHHLGASRPAVYEAIDRLVEHGVLRELTAAKRNRAWTATAIQDELADLLSRTAT